MCLNILGGKRSWRQSAWKVEGSRTYGANPVWRAFWFTLLLVAGFTNSDNGPDVEGEALLDLLKGLNDSNRRINWDQYFVSPCYSWMNVTCRNGHVISLKLASYGLSGTLSPHIAKLKFLESLLLQDNDLSGPLPDSIGDLVALQNLDLANNKFTGHVPNSWAQLSNLKHLDLSCNDVTGQIPTQLFSVPSFNFTGTGLGCGSGFEHPCVSDSSSQASTRGLRIKVLAISSSCAALIILVAILLFFSYRHHQVQRVRPEAFVALQKIRPAGVRRIPHL